MAAHQYGLPERLLELLGHLRGEGPEVGQRTHRDQIGIERLCPLEHGLVAVHPGEVRRLQEEVVVEARVENEVDLVSVRLDHGHEVSDPEVLDAPVVEENAHTGGRSPACSRVVKLEWLN